MVSRLFHRTRECKKIYIVPIRECENHYRKPSKYERCTHYTRRRVKEAYLAFPSPMLCAQTHAHIHTQSLSSVFTAAFSEYIRLFALYEMHFISTLRLPLLLLSLCRLYVTLSRSEYFFFSLTHTRTHISKHIKWCTFLHYIFFSSSFSLPFFHIFCNT